MNIKRHAWLAVSGLVAALLGGASLAWACGPQAHISVDPSSGPPGGEIRVTGSEFTTASEPEGMPVEIRWNSVNGPLLAEARGPKFTKVVTVPKVPEDDYVIVAISSEDEKGNVFRPSAAFTVKKEGREPVTTGSTSGRESRGGAKSTTTSGSPAQSGGGKTTAVSRGAAQGSTVPDEAPSLQAGGRSVAEVGERSLQAAGRDRPTGVTSRVFAASVGAGQRVGEAAPDAAGSSGTGLVSERSASGDLRSGFASPDRPSLLPGFAEPVVPAEGPGSSLALGIGLLSLGLVTLFAGFLVAELRRRRAAASSRR